MRKYLVEVRNNKNEELTLELSNVKKSEIDKIVAAEGYSVIKCESGANHHICKYCNSIAEGTDEDILCSDCREMFGHAFYSQL